MEFKTLIVQCKNDDSEILFYICSLFKKKNISAFIIPKDLQLKLRRFECFCNLKKDE